MTIEIGGNYLVEAENILAIFDIDSVTVKERGREFFNMNQNLMIYTDEKELPRSCVIVFEEGENMLYVTPMNSGTILKRISETEYKKGYLF